MAKAVPLPDVKSLFHKLCVIIKGSGVFIIGYVVRDLGPLLDLTLTVRGGGIVLN